MDNFRAHLVQRVKELLNKGKIDPLVIPGGATEHIQTPDVSWSKPIKDQLREINKKWMDEGPHTHTKSGNMCRPSLKQIVQWILKAWLDLDKEIIIRSFCCCALSMQDDGSEDNEIACFKPEKPLNSGLERLKTAMAEAAKSLLIPSLNQTSKMNQVWLLIQTGKKLKTLILSKH